MHFETYDVTYKGNRTRICVKHTEWMVETIKDTKFVTVENKIKDLISCGKLNPEDIEHCIVVEGSQVDKGIIEDTYNVYISRVEKYVLYPQRICDTSLKDQISAFKEKIDKQIKCKFDKIDALYRKIEEPEVTRMD